MGADLLMAYWWTKKKDVDWAAGHAVIDTLGIDDLDPSGFEEYDEDSDIGSTATLDRLRSTAHQTLRGAKALWTGKESRRDAFVCEMGPLTVLISGGMSWGDDPTESFREMNDMPEAALKAAGFFE